jgi:hypothetical protein
LAFVAAPAFVFDMANGRTEGAVDTRPVIPTAISLVRQGDWDVSEFAHSGGERMLRDHRGALAACFQVRGDRIYSAYPHGMVLFALPVTALSHLCGTDLDAWPVHIRLQKLTAALVMSLCLGLFFLTAARLGRPRAAAVATAYLATASALFTTAGMGLWQHGGVAFWLLLVLLVEFHTAGRPSGWGTLAQGLACGLLLTCRPTASLLVLAFGTWVLLRSPRRALATAAIAALTYLPCLALYLTVYGNPVGPATIVTNSTDRTLWQFGRLHTLMGVLFCPARGLFVYQPWALLALAMPWSWRAVDASAPGAPARPRGWPAFCGAAVALHVLLISCWYDWAGGWCWGSRLLTEVLPLLGLLCVGPIAALESSRWGRWLLVAIGVISLGPHIPCAFLGSARWNNVTDHAGDLWSWARAPFFYLPR